MARTTQTLVEGIIDNFEEFEMAPFIESANVLVTRVCSLKETTGGSLYYTDEDLELIERWLSAHFFAIRFPRSVSEQAGPVMERTQSKVDIGFDVTHYGQMALRLDTAGGLAALNEDAKKGKGRIELYWAGTEPE